MMLPKLLYRHLGSNCLNFPYLEGVFTKWTAFGSLITDQMLLLFDNSPDAQDRHFCQGFTNAVSIYT